jgi:hypothetical protein
MLLLEKYQTHDLRDHVQANKLLIWCTPFPHATAATPGTPNQTRTTTAALLLLLLLLLLLFCAPHKLLEVLSTVSTWVDARQTVN